jgi:ornithine cyclodeaminase/alanine dehydrogenase-like protein (mu-crystallin family)
MDELLVLGHDELESLGISLLDVVDVLAVPASGRRVFCNMGIAMDDVALGALCYDRAVEQGVGRTIAFP